MPIINRSRQAQTDQTDQTHPSKDLKIKQASKHTVPWGNMYNQSIFRSNLSSKEHTPPHHHRHSPQSRMTPLQTHYTDIQSTRKQLIHQYSSIRTNNLMSLSQAQKGTIHIPEQKGWNNMIFMRVQLVFHSLVDPLGAKSRIQHDPRILIQFSLFWTLSLQTMLIFTLTKSLLIFVLGKKKKKSW
jgi:hypothetical protein